ncbi:hypothetical protein A2U01_0100224, partial [Trifolium medium]|nr:hypothetical protein [Trifolium medium]
MVREIYEDADLRYIQ